MGQIKTTWKRQDQSGNYFLEKRFDMIKFIPSFCILHPYQIPTTVFISSDASYYALSTQCFKGRRGQTCFKFFREYEIKQSLTWSELSAIQLALQSLAPKISNKSVCWETDNYADLLVTQSHKRSKNIQKSRHECIISGTVLILPLGVGNETATRRMGLYF